ncbi:MAG: hypothetical protein JWP31_284 [Aeromicrobium sp.]|nr:hypothetical protein [Aeromicrobium sp.]
MPTPNSVHEQLTDILVRVVGCRADEVVPTATLRELGTDSLTVVEVGEELGRRFDVYLSDATIDGLTTVKDAIDAVVGHDGSQPPRGAFRIPALPHHPAPASDAPTPEVIPVDEQQISERRSKAGGFAVWFAVIGLVIGGVLGLGGAALVSATGIDQVDMPPLVASSTPEPTASTASTPAPKPTQSVGVPEPSVEVSSSQVSPGETFELMGVFPGSDAGEQLQVEVKDEGADWDEFPIKPVTREGGAFKADLYTSRTGAREFRVTNTVTNVSTPAVKVEIG